MAVNITKDKFNLREKLKELERPSVDNLVTKDKNGAYIDTIRGNTKLESIDSVISDTAVDIVVYDTSKDSDGGAWRKRVQNTTWYNETLNTSTRGSRRDFPSVAVIVLQSTTMTIYDGDDPSLPMWMVFNRGTDSQVTMWWDGNNGNVGKSVDALNGFIIMGTSNAGSFGVDFIGERWMYLYNGPTNCGWRTNTDIVNRNIAISSRTVGRSFGSGVGASAHEVKITALSNAPIDPVTNLPVPTIAIASSNGAFLIRDGYSGSGNFQETVSGLIHLTVGMNKELLFRSDISNGGIVGSALNSANIGAYYKTASNVRILSNANADTTNLIEVPDKNTLIVGQTPGLSIVNADFSEGNTYNSSVCHITSTYNTGWMHGNIVGSWINDVSAGTTTSTGTNLITNGDGTSTTGWTVNANNTLTIDSGRFKCVSSVSDGAFFGQSFSVEAGKTYQIQATSISDGTSKAVRTFIGTVNGSGDILAGPDSYIAGTTVIYYTATVSRTIWVWFYAGGAAGVGNYILVDNVSVRLAEQNRAIRGGGSTVESKGLGIFGSLTKSPVATNSNLTAYSGFSANNYLEQPYLYTPELNLGTSDFSIMFWMRSSRTATATYGDIVCLGDLGALGFANATRHILFQVNGATSTTARLLPYYKDSASGSTSFSTFPNFPINTWQHVCMVRKDNTLYFYMNGYLIESKICTGSFAPPSAPDQNFRLKVGHSGPNYSYPASQESISLLKISLTAPSAQQITKIFNDEKILFEDNIKCNIHGTSDSITALAYDDATKRLHVGTSSGRSDFMGISRINNTTTAVTTAISAYDGFVVEQ